jgi:hypothetical protein
MAEAVARLAKRSWGVEARSAAQERSAGEWSVGVRDLGVEALERRRQVLARAAHVDLHVAEYVTDTSAARLIQEGDVVLLENTSFDPPSLEKKAS